LHYFSQNEFDVFLRELDLLTEQINNIYTFRIKLIRFEKTLVFSVSKIRFSGRINTQDEQAILKKTLEMFETLDKKILSFVKGLNFCMEEIEKIKNMIASDLSSKNTKIQAIFQEPYTTTKEIMNMLYERNMQANMRNRLDDAGRITADEHEKYLLEIEEKFNNIKTNIDTIKSLLVHNYELMEKNFSDFRIAFDSIRDRYCSEHIVCCLRYAPSDERRSLLGSESVRIAHQTAKQRAELLLPFVTSKTS
jgi:FtsZ-binding cell division protein ZapB